MAAMFEGWDNYFVLLGTASAGLIGLLFVVITLTSNFERSRALWADLQWRFGCHTLLHCRRSSVGFCFIARQAEPGQP